FAVNKLGAVSVPVNTGYKGEFLRHQVADSGAGVVIAESAYVDRITAVLDGLTGVRTILHRDSRPEREPAGAKLLAFDEALFDDDSTLPDPNRPGDLTCLIYTAGTT